MKPVVPKVSIPVLLFGIGIFFMSLSKDDKLSRIINTFNNFRSYFPFEKIYIHTDKAYYTLGENIWFKVYLTNGRNRPDSLSGVVYVELINRERKVIRNVILKADHSTCKGDFFLPDTLSSGTYQLRAYTNYMRNPGAGSFFRKNIPVFQVGYKKYNWQITSVHPDTIAINQYLYKIVLRDWNNQPKADFSIQYIIKAKRLKTIMGESKTASDGSFLISLEIPENKQISNCKIELSIPGEKQKWNYNLPLVRESPFVRFFPEGGNLVEGVINKLAFKITGAMGLGIKAKILVFNQDSILIANSSSNRFGMGALWISPNGSEKYHSYIQINDDYYGRYSLGKIQKTGYVLHVNNFDKDSIFIKAVRNFDLENQKPWSIIFQTKGKAVFKISGMPFNGKLQATIPKSKLRDGVYQITLFDQDFFPQCERLIFINSGNKPDIELTKSKLDDGTYSFTAILKDTLMKSANISVSIINKDIVDNLFPFQENIFSYLELTSELRGQIESPGYYFIDDSLMRAVDLDYLLMTQGWRKFLWKKMLNGEIPDFKYPVENAIKVSGIISNYNNKKKMGDEVILMLYKGENTQIFQSNSDSLGRFCFYTNFNDTVKAIVQTKRKKSNIDRRVILDKRSIPPIGRIIPFIPDKKAYQSLNQMKESGQIRNTVEKMYKFDTDYSIPEVTVTGKNWVWRHKKKPEKVLMVEEMEEEIMNRNRYEYYSVLHFIADNYSGVTLMTDSYDFNNYLFVNGKFALVVLDGKALLGEEYISFLPKVDWHSLKKVEILNSGGNLYANVKWSVPVICLYSNPGGKIRVRNVGIRKFKLTGYYLAKEFYNPIASEDVTGNIPEYRSTVYWNPEIICDSTGILSFHVDRKSLPENTAICIEGITDYGKPLHVEFGLSR